MQTFKQALRAALKNETVDLTLFPDDDRELLAATINCVTAINRMAVSLANDEPTPAEAEQDRRHDFLVSCLDDSTLEVLGGMVA